MIFNFKKTAFYDIETVPLAPELDQLDERMRDLWIKRSCKTNGQDADHNESYKRDGCFMAEYSKVVCISYGIFTKPKDVLLFRVKTIVGDNEKELLQQFAKDLESLNVQSYVLCGHNIKGFDGPFLCKRFLINRLPIPLILNTAGKKPWEIAHQDTMELWRFGGFGGNISLDLLAACFDIPSPKTVMDGAHVQDFFYAQKYDEIGTYCAGDVVTTANVALAWSNMPLLEPHDIIFV